MTSEKLCSNYIPKSKYRSLRLSRNSSILKLTDFQSTQRAENKARSPQKYSCIKLIADCQNSSDLIATMNRMTETKQLCQYQIELTLCNSYPGLQSPLMCVNTRVIVSLHRVNVKTRGHCFPVTVHPFILHTVKFIQRSLLRRVKHAKINGMIIYVYWIEIRFV